MVLSPADFRTAKEPILFLKGALTPHDPDLTRDSDALILILMLERPA